MRLGRLGHDPMAAPPKVGFDGKPGRVERQELKAEQASGPVLLPALAGRAPLDRPRKGRGSDMGLHWPQIIRGILARTGWSTNTLARKLGVSNPCVRNWYGGRFIPSKKIDKAIVDLYRVHVGELP